MGDGFTVTHSAHEVPFEMLWDNLQQHKSSGLVSESIKDGLHLFNYTERCVYEKLWDRFTLIARGLILDPNNKQIVATPFPKFFNYGERVEPLPDEPFDVFEKMDGSLIVLFFYHGKWQAATRGSFTSEQAAWAAKWIEQRDLSALDINATYLAEAIYPENRIVVRYDESGLVLLGGYDVNGHEIPYQQIVETACTLGWSVAARRSFGSLDELLAFTSTLPATQEGFVVRFQSGLRIKVKGAEYCRIHKLISRVTPLALWEAMMCGDDLEGIRREIPEEFWSDFDSIRSILQSQIDANIQEVSIVADELVGMTDKEVGLMMDQFSPIVRKMIFPYRNNGGNLMVGRTKEALYGFSRPKGNQLDGYVPSYLINRVLADV